jgi:RNA polymerase sigma-70 factor (ECF subfamily)
VEDSELVKQFQAGNEQAFNELVNRHRKEVYYLALGMVGNHDDAEDLAQEAFVRAYRSLPKFRGESGFYTWLYRITVNLCLNHLRTRRVRSFIGLEKIEAVVPSGDETDAEAELQELSAAARQAIQALPDKQRAVFILRHFQELPHAEIAKIMGREEGTIKANYFQAVRKLRQALRPHMRGDE